ncbi:MAG TPA: DmsC/YnfH family molybdoenzyme membrane anchor subunit [Dokdonella sp.]|uniref:dimethyl sulfoxide reductase anchor subunit family protein n=1 Tax=Dokdonella sp. TaxID=2291710 RepID=UPI002C8AA731|nr:DmsC/YnfH family molybdoenzyme membrane anchor subunit [Dokdonella sp.]HUD43239.1 DmsC/YnfH family molybdoenzyme membrane anchor subunit [Dokdonella sp.]
MRPALSIVFFTTLSGAGYGLWVLIAIAVAIGAAPADRLTIVAALLTGLALTSIGLLASVAHLGKPLRAWRALGQWRSSWLSREAVLALACVPLCLLLAWRVESVHSGLRIRIGFAVFALLAAATVVCTARIYASLRTVRAWRDWRATPLYGLYALQTGGLWLWLLVAIAAPRTAEGAIGAAAGSSAWLAALAAGIVLTSALQRAYWRRPDDARPDTAAATGLGPPGSVAAMEAPHTEENYLLREMGFALARRHAERLRAIASRTLFALPLLAIGMGLLLPAWALPAAIAGTASAMVGVFVQRWLFFAEARHVVQAYYR